MIVLTVVKGIACYNMLPNEICTLQMFCCFILVTDIFRLVGTRFEARQQPCDVNSSSGYGVMLKIYAKVLLFTGDDYNACSIRNLLLKLQARQLGVYSKCFRVS